MSAFEICGMCGRQYDTAAAAHSCDHTLAGPSDKALQIAAQCWCESTAVMDIELAVAFAKRLDNDYAAIAELTERNIKLTARAEKAEAALANYEPPEEPPITAEEAAAFEAHLKAIVETPEFKQDIKILADGFKKKADRAKEIERLETELAKYRDEYDNLCKIATDYEQRFEKERAVNKVLVEALVYAIDDVPHGTYTMELCKTAITKAEELRK
jgi:hypothetical protein